MSAAASGERAMRRPASRRRLCLAVAIVGLLLSGCATNAAPGTPSTPGGAASASATPTAACPQVEGVDLPPECAPYDQEAAMALNDRHRERVELDEDAQGANAEVVPSLTAALEDLRVRGAATEDSVRAALSDAGLIDAQVRGDYGRILFGAVGPGGGCVFGEVADAVAVDVGGYILDGGCLPAQ
ncbi:hypothetical protein E4V99_15320 [Microbacterium sp. dk485]|uniref:hypothetical protein n=1 Tax=Microbacterium sp. dk485 TaxID=2560021 RepID=UPI001072FC3E|nr:hypothetical protein [Microbacterium sp. dk485]TFV82279.1 hypothetical protein E4V99_15320 [Microbacterium sp. dk485]